MAEPPDPLLAATTAAAIVAEFAAACPIAAPSDEAAHQACQDALAAKDVARHLRPLIFYGGEKPGVAVKDAELTKFGPDLWARLYLSLFMTDGGAEPLRWDEANGLYRLRVRAAFRNEMAPGRYPYPFWHNPAKWQAYEKNQVVDFLIGAEDGLVAAAFRQPVGDGLAHLVTRPVQPPPFDGKSWTWRDDAGHLQPVVSLFEGFYRPGNPELARLDATYRDMALELRDNSCTHCHVPANPYHLKKLVLLQTPAHAADMIDRVVAAVGNGKMPYDEDYDAPRALTGGTLSSFLARAQAFQSAVHDANAWEHANPRGAAGQVVKAQAASSSGGP